MRAPFKTKLGMTFTVAPSDISKLGRNTIHFTVALETPLEMDGNKFGFLVAPFVATGDSNLTQAGAGVLCQTRAEADDTRNKLDTRRKLHLGVVQWSNGGTVAWAGNLRNLREEIGAFQETAPDGSKKWFAIIRDTDTVTLATTETRRQECPTKQAAVALKKQWVAERERQKRLPSPITPPPPPNPDRVESPWAPRDDRAAAAARMAALRRQWPASFTCMDAPHSSEQDIIDAYLIDMAGQGVPDLSAAAVPMRPDLELITRLAAAAGRYAKRKKSNTIITALYLVAFNWTAGWCYRSDTENANALSEMLKPAKFTARQVEHFRLRELGGLYAKHKTGPEPNCP